LGFSEGRFQRIKLILEEVNEFRSSTGDLQSGSVIYCDSHQEFDQKNAI